MRRLIISPAALAAEADILEFSFRQFGEAAMDRYLPLIQRGFGDVLTAPETCAIRTHLLLPPGMHLFSLEVSRRRLPLADRPASASRLLVYRYDDTVVEVLDILHERMDIPARLG